MLELRKPRSRILTICRGPIIIMTSPLQPESKQQLPYWMLYVAGMIIARQTRSRHMPGSDDDHTGDAANGLLQNILERVSNGDSCLKKKPVRECYAQCRRSACRASSVDVGHVSLGRDSWICYGQCPCQLRGRDFEWCRVVVYTTVHGCVLMDYDHESGYQYPFDACRSLAGTSRARLCLDWWTIDLAMTHETSSRKCGCLSNPGHSRVC